MAGTEDNSSTIEYWPPPNSSSRTLSNSSNEEFGSKSLPIFLAENGNVGPSWKSETQRMGPSTKAEEGEAGVNDSNEFSLQSKSFGAPISCSSGGLAERMATRKGFNVPKLDTAGIPPASMSSHTDIHSPYLTIPPGLSPTMLLESPVFLADPMVRYQTLNLLCTVMSFRRHSKKAQLSPTTGKFQFGENVASNPILVSDSSDPTKSEDDLFEDIPEAFAFKPPPESHLSLSSSETKVMW
ncbi:hypothetical protein GW17_00051708 [Ensete ventricosum]|nr:hypothetical protein GW17_00051708 [Ensete ventricosum]